MTEINSVLKQVGIPSIKEVAFRNGITRQAVNNAFTKSPHLFNKYLNICKYMRASARLKIAVIEHDRAKAGLAELRKYKKVAGQ